MTSGSSFIPLLIAAACLALVVWAMAVTEETRNVYGHSLPASYGAPASH
jgi:hypothetical protein